ncbi:transposase IS4 family protein [Candidatus Brocadia sinica JPN1]|uniref:Transposase IS4 family protein n=1 Tax=Candidatus Brocadia sinica JPN1 TaxID=1197129 RepID=A0ABQ0JT41_9BACT|nr:transposase IS4 family protein [Candidatus Brocadia sinica JPN1]GJQ19194.1 MAG: hypothetical protein HBSIN01_31530 [Candidatus Brocadia sinica]
MQQQVLYLRELNDTQRTGWVRTIEALWGEKTKAKQLALFPDDREELPVLACEAIRVRLDKIELRRPREWGACWVRDYKFIYKSLKLIDIMGFHCNNCRKKI